jgi:hypothetical protein
VLSADAGPAVSPTERPLLLACFNGGFKVGDRVGGTMADRQTLVSLQPGLATLDIDSYGIGEVGVWGQGFPTPGADVVAARQNLQPLVEGGQPSPLVNNLGAWGSTLHGATWTARSALGMDGNFDLLYAASMGTVPADLAGALVASGATTAMQLDINPSWPYVDVASTPGGPLTAGLPGQERPADQCLTGWTRDFVAVLSRAPA